MKKVLLSVGVWALPALALAQVPNVSNGVYKIIGLTRTVLSALVPIFIGVGLVVFLWGVIKYVLNDDSEKKEKARTQMIYGIIGLFVMVSVWGLVNLLSQTFDLGGTNTAPIGPSIPNIPF